VESDIAADDLVVDVLEALLGELRPLVDQDLPVALGLVLVEEQHVGVHVDVDHLVEDDLTQAVQEQLHAVGQRRAPAGLAPCDAGLLGAGARRVPDGPARVDGGEFFRMSPAILMCSMTTMPQEPQNRS
jgi:hypothetical protein